LCRIGVEMKLFLEGISNYFCSSFVLFICWLSVGYGLNSQSSIPIRSNEGIFFSLQLCQDWLWGLPTLLSSGTRGFFPGVKGLGCEADHLPPSRAKIKNSWSYTSTHLIHLYGMMLR
jgi:hypothetical protein